MTTRHEVTRRWTTDTGQSVVALVRNYLWEINVTIGTEEPLQPVGDAIEILRAMVGNMPYVEEVTPNLDLRGFPFQEHGWIRGVDLSGAHFDYAPLPGGIGWCKTEQCSFRECSGHSGSLSGDFRNCSFERARLSRCSFYGSILEGANFTGTSLTSCRFNEANCRGARFTGCNLRFAEMPKADLRGADLSGADLTDAVMGSVIFDETTRLAGAVLTGASMNKDFLEFVLKAGAIRVEGGSSAYDLAILDGMSQRIERHRGLLDDAVISEALEVVKNAKARYEADPTFVWMNQVDTDAPPHLQELLAKVFKGASWSPGG